MMRPMTDAADTFIKICGLRDIDAAEAAVRAGANAVGLVFAAGSPREVDVATARGIADALPQEVAAVGVFVDMPADQIKRIADDAHLQIVQLHGRETRDDVEALAPLRVIKSIAFKEQDARDALQPWRDPPANLAAMLYDTPPPAAMLGEKVTGGYGESFDWHSFAQLQADGVFRGLPPSILAGGLTPANVAEAIEIVHPFGVDVSSGVESSRGVKSIDLIEQFCAAVRQSEDAG